MQTETYKLKHADRNIQTERYRQKHTGAYRQRLSEKIGQRIARICIYCKPNKLWEKAAI